MNSEGARRCHGCRQEYPAKDLLGGSRFRGGTYRTDYCYQCSAIWRLNKNVEKPTKAPVNE